MNIREVMQQALEALDLAQAVSEQSRHHKTILAAYTSLRAALSEEAMQRLTDVQQEMEPAAWMLIDDGGVSFVDVEPPEPYRTNEGWVALYPAQQREWVGLTDEEIKHQWAVWRASVPRYHGFAKGIEAKLKKKNHG